MKNVIPIYNDILCGTCSEPTTQFALFKTKSGRFFVLGVCDEVTCLKAQIGTPRKYCGTANIDKVKKHNNKAGCLELVREIGKALSEKIVTREEVMEEMDRAETESIIKDIIE